MYFILISLLFLSHRYIFNLIYKIGITSVYAVEVHDSVFQMQNKSQSFLLDTFMSPEVSVDSELLGVR